MTPTTAALILSNVLFLLMLIIGAVALRGRKPKTTLRIIGFRPSVRRVYERRIKPVRGMYTWKEPGEFEADVYCQPEFIDKDQDGDGFMAVDLETYHPIRYDGHGNGHPVTEEQMTWLRGKMKGVRFVAGPVAYHGQCRNDGDPTHLPRLLKDGGKTRAVNNIWRRLTGTKLAEIRRDIRLKQQAGPRGLAEVLIKALPWAVLVLIVLVIALIVMVAKLA